MLINAINEIKDNISPFKIGDEVLCYWGSDGYNQEGIVVDPLVNYNGFNEFNKDNIEPACVIRFKNTMAQTGAELGLNVVVPHRQIKKI